MTAHLKIGILARNADCPVETIRYYEREGLLPVPGRTDGNYRLYSADDVERLAFIRNCRSLDMTLEEIRQLLRLKDTPRESCEDANALVDAHVGHVEERITELQRLKSQLKGLRRRCAAAGNSKDCGILDGLSRRAPLRAEPPSRRHIHGAHRR